MITEIRGWRQNDTVLAQVRKTLEQFHMIEQGEKIVVGVSGGADSMCLLAVLQELAPEWDLQLHVVHVNHLLREEAAEEERYVREYCNKQGIPCTVFHKDIKEYAEEAGCSIEEAGRDYRYECFELACRQEKCQKIAVAHHQKDRVETLLFHMLRGTGMRGLGSIPAVRGKIIRPLLYVDRAEIEHFLQEHGIGYVTDASNATDDYSRNLIRNRILPQIQDVNAQAIPHMAAVADLAQEYWQYVEGQAQIWEKEWVKIRKDRVLIDSGAMKSQPELLQRHVIYRLLTQLAGSAKDIRQIHVEQIRSLLDKPVGKQIHLPYGLMGCSRYESICIQKTDSVQTDRARDMEPVMIQVPGIVRLNGIGEIACSLRKIEQIPEISKKVYTKMFDYDKINDTLCVRNPRAGDYFIMNVQGERKKLSRYFVDHKIAQEERQRMLVLAEGDRIDWIIGQRIGEDVKITETTKTVLQVEFRYQGEEHG